MIELIFATQNQNKRDEVKRLLNSNYKIISLKDLGFHDDLDEDFNTLRENALQKAEFIANKYESNCFAEDSGLFIECLALEPGVKSARYAGEDKNDKANIELVLEKLRNIENRNAYFKTVIALIIDSNKYFFEGTCNGSIAHVEKGDFGFGYDPIFIPQGYTKSFAELDQNIKNEISHRAKAFFSFKQFMDDFY
jgi:XTP/dITP diphosphohydrolase